MIVLVVLGLTLVVLGAFHIGQPHADLRWLGLACLAAAAFWGPLAGLVGR